MLPLALLVITTLSAAPARTDSARADSVATATPAPAAATAPTAAPSSPATSAPAPAPAAPAEKPIPIYWQTKAERTGYRVTPDYEETMRYLRQLEAGSRWISVQSFGVSEQGREMPLVVVSKDRVFTPEAARASGKAIVLIQNGIHAGEIEGKDASLALIRDLAVLRTRAELLDHAILLVLPMFSTDAHERRSRYHRINQDGPEEQGWRFTPIGLNLNRDYLKAETPEMRALLGQVFTRWWPHLLVDNHTSDGADFRHDVMYGFNAGASAPASLDRWLIGAFEGRVVPRIAAMGHLPAPYIAFRRGSDPMSGVDLGASTPRFSTGYTPLQCRPSILVETHSLKPYEIRVRSTYDLMVALLEEINAHPAELIGAVAAAESEAVARGRATDPARRIVTLTTRMADHATPFEFKGVATRMEPSEITGAPVPRYGAAPWDTIIPLYREVVPAIQVTQPVGYLVPQEWTVARDRMQVHAVRFRRFAKAWSDTVEVQRILEWSSDPKTFEGHHQVQVTKVALERRLRSFHPGDLWVPLDQRSAMVAVQLFEAQAPDGLMRWNAFDTVFEPKEYAEGYIMEPIARKMMREDSSLAKEFNARVAADTAFARSPQARLDFFYRRSPWADPEQSLHPIARALHAPPETVLAPE